MLSSSFARNTCAQTLIRKSIALLQETLAHKLWSEKVLLCVLLMSSCTNLTAVSIIGLQQIWYILQALRFKEAKLSVKATKCCHFSNQFAPARHTLAQDLELKLQVLLPLLYFDAMIAYKFWQGSELHVYIQINKCISTFWEYKSKQY